ncbi:hypothetical protein HY625_00870 [Candidatus Uhrbacteria bacterium]|nr:hypothetical protein [Candidatus Uhrbacteria bacterium]
MGYLSWLSSKKLLTHIEIKQKLFHVTILTQKQREAVEEALRAYEGGGGVSSYELKHALDRLRGVYAISEMDRQKIIQILFES